ncbi:hypothetical protein Dimus_005319 [Dionaea muscipula]
MASTLDSAADQLSKLHFDSGDGAACISNLNKNLSLLSSDQVELAQMLLEMGQNHLFDQWPEPGVDDEEKLGFFEQVPTGENLTFADDNFIKYEEAGIREAQNAAFVLVAGGLGERLGYNGIKIALPSESCSGTCFLQHYIESILALQEASCRLIEGGCHREVPFAIMTSDDTHARTLALLESNSYFGMKHSQVTLLKQEKVACLADNDARLAIDPNNKYRIQTKPHGHGDVHSLLYSSGLLKIWPTSRKLEYPVMTGCCRTV